MPGPKPNASVGEPPGRGEPIHLPPKSLLNSPIIIFVTVCAQGRRRILCREEAHRLLMDSWTEADAWGVGKYVVMPDHLHLFCAPRDGRNVTPGRWVQYWKALVSRRWPRPKEQPIWQRSFWDTQLRRSERYEEKWEYVRANPVRKRLAEAPELWPYQGEMNVLRW